MSYLRGEWKTESTRTPAGQTASVAVRMMKPVFSQVCICMDVRMNTCQCRVGETCACVSVCVRM